MPFPTEIDPLFKSLRQEVIGLHFCWANYRQAFGATSDRIDVLNRCAPQFFFIIQDVLMTDVQMSLAKLADAAQTLGRKNATLERLYDEFARLDPAAPISAIKAGLDDYRAKCALIKVRRHKELAHYDLGTMLQQYGHAPITTLLPGPSRQEIEEALGALRSFMNLIEGYYDHSETAYTVVYEGGAETLVSVLEDYIKRHDADGVI